MTLSPIKLIAGRIPLHDKYTGGSKLHYNSDSGFLKEERCPNNGEKCKKDV
jgi:hypothetical protein